MDSTPNQVYEDFLPSSKLVQEEHFDTLHLTLPDFKKEELRIQLTKTGILMICGQRPIGKNKWQRFQREFSVAQNCDKTKISAKFENGILHVKQPKLITSSVKKENESIATLAENTPAAKRQTTTSRDEISKQDNADMNTPAKEETKNNSTKTNEQTEAKSLAEKKLPTDESSSSSSSYSESTDETTDDETIENMKNSNGAEVVTPAQVYEDFVPSSKLVHEEEHYYILQLNAPDFKKEQLRVRLTRTGILIISGQRPIGENKWQRFQKEFPVAENCDSSKIRAKFEFGILHVIQPKLVTLTVEKDKELAATGAETIGNSSCLDANLKKPRRLMKMTLVSLSVLAIGLYVANVMKSANKAEE